VILALSVHSFVDKIGAYVGFAAAIGLALFAMLLFAQARELKRLREWGAHAHDRIGELERRLAAALELARRASTSQRTMPPAPGPGPRPAAARPAAPARAAPAIARTSAPTRLPLLPAAPALVGGAALGSATVFVPLPKQPPGVAPAAALPGVPAPAVAPAARPATAPAVAAAAAASAAPAAATPAPATAAGQAPASPPMPAQPAPVPGAPAPSPAPPAATNGHSDTFPPVPPVRRATPRPGVRPPAGRRPPVRPGQRPVPAAPLRARRTPHASPRASGNGTVEAPHGRRRLALLLGGLGAVAVVAIAIVLLSGGGNDSPSLPTASNSAPIQQTTGAARGTTPSAGAPAHDRVTVAVLNGTPTPGLASTVATTLTSDGFKRGPVGNASDQQRSVTVVSYFGGHDAEAQEVASTLNVPADAVQPIDADTETACASGATTCAATVVVTVGADRQ
jgi:LytR cell envelope-related transcriptional attenuator